ncbi:MAG TPA: response regulator transcription factor [Oscillatoriaceae cyanobacterium]
MTPPIRIAVVDDHPAVRRGTCELIEEEEGLEVVGTGGNGDEAIALVERESPDVLLLDIQMPQRDGISALRELRRRGNPVGVLMMSAADDTRIVEALSAGANGYLLKTATEEEIARAIRLVAAGQSAILQPEVAQAMVAATRRAESTELLSEREIQVLKTLAKDMANKEIARELGISDRTVQQHLANIFGKLGVASRTGAVLKALQAGILSLEDTRP